MSDRLISTDKLKETLSSFEKMGCCECKLPVCKYKQCVFNAIDEQPTAYDVDDVIAKLEKGLQNAKEHKEKGSYSDDYINGFINGYERAINIIKGGDNNA